MFFRRLCLLGLILGWGFAPAIASAVTSLPDPSLVSTGYQRGTTAKIYRQALTDYQAGDYSSAEEGFIEVVWNDPKDWESYEYLGHCRYRLGKTALAQQAYERSLRLKPKNPALASWVERLGEGGTEGVSEQEPPTASQPPATPDDEGDEEEVAEAPPAGRRVTYVGGEPPTRARASVAGNEPQIHTSFRRSGWSRFFWGYNQGTLTELKDAADGWKRVGSLSGNATASMGQGGLHVGGEVGFMLASQHGFSLGMEYLNWKDYRASYSGADEYGDPWNAWQSIDPVSVPFYLTYHYFIPSDKMRLSVSAGVGYEWANFRYREVNTDQDIALDLTGGGFGVKAAVTAEWPIRENWGFHLSLIGRMATVKDIEADYWSDASGSGRATLAADSDGMLYVTDVLDATASGLHPVKVDLSGISAVMGITYYLW